jgi:hypothetical protein
MQAPSPLSPPSGTPRPATPLPDLAWLLGASGLIPFLGLGLGAALGWDELLFPLLAYGATILAFLGAVHWGLALQAVPDEKPAERVRLVLGVVPSLVAWVALLLPVGTGLAVVAGAILLTAAMETVAAQARLMPAGYLRLRWVLSLGAALSLGLGITATGG